MHHDGGSLDHQLDLTGQGDQLLQGNQCHIGAEAGGEDAQVLHMGEILADPPGNRQQRVHAALQRKDFGGVLAMTGEIKAHRSGGEHVHLLGNAGLDGIPAAAADTMNTQHDPLDGHAVGNGQGAGGFQGFMGQKKSSFHTGHLSK